ncbi:L,D-transpeptidase [Butyrivibrio sp. FCS014]|uniref:L,D-transpeptidase n=1 Tax=Butyrivibrio sp. FCS014 TaxID=1408304 RepID=UPI000464B2E5|nr:L,D-transpeptidase [Butyrivibrio sp. FCS014]
MLSHNCFNHKSNSGGAASQRISSCSKKSHYITASKKLISLATVFAVAAILWCSPTKAYASGFDPVYYAERYPDVANAVGTSQKALIQHYIDYGVYEGRFQNAAEEEAGTPLNTYIDINLTNQTVTYILDGEQVLQTPCVTGDVSQNRETPTGVFAIYAHIPGQYLTGPDWHVWVDYWMPFYGGIGLHDATWRGKFGGNIYKTAGSHGCVNISHKAAKELFNMVGIGTVVTVHE